MGFHQLVIASPAALPTGTRPEAIPPTAAARKNGVRIDESTKSAPTTALPRSVPTAPRVAKVAPRKMIPTAARKRGM